MERLKPLHISRLRDIVERHDAKGDRVAFSISYACMNGTVIDIESKSVVCISVEPERHRRKLRFTENGEVRMVHDILILRVNDSKIVVS